MMKGRPKKHQNPEEAKKAQKEKIRLWRLNNKDRIKSKVKEYHKKNPDIIKKSHKKYYDKRIIKDKYAYINEEFFQRNIKEYKPEEGIKKKIKEYKPTKRIAKPKFIKVAINKCPNCNKLFSTKKQGNRKYCQNCSVKGGRKRKRIYTVSQRKKWNQKYLSTEKGQTTQLWDTLRKRIKKYTFSKVQTTRKDMNKLTGCSKYFLLKFIESKFYDHPVTNKKMTWVNAKDWHIDHITPLKALNPKNVEHFKIANHFSNLQPMWADENLRKGANVTPGYGVAHLKRKYKTLQSLGDLTNIRSKPEAEIILKKVSKLI